METEPEVVRVRLVRAKPSESDDLKNRYSKWSAERLENGVKKEWEGLVEGSRSLVGKGITIGEMLIALRPLCPHGTWEAKLEQLGISRTQAKRFLALGENADRARRLLKEKPELTMQQAEMMFRGSLEDMPNDLPFGDGEEKQQRAKGTVKKTPNEDAMTKRAETALKKSVEYFNHLIQSDPLSYHAMSYVQYLKQLVKLAETLHAQSLEKAEKEVTGE